MSRSPGWIAAAVVLALAVFLRSTVVDGAFPYMSYIDEGRILHPVQHMLLHATWDPTTYNYPSLLAECIAGGAAAIDWALVRAGGESFVARIPPRHAEFYDRVGPGELLVVGRAVVALFAVGTVLAVAAVARRLGGRRAALLSMLAAAVLPALVSRSSIVIVDTVAAFFVVLTLLLALASSEASSPLRGLLASGAAAGFAFGAKYPSGAVLVVPLVMAALDGRLSTGRKLGAALACGLGFGVAAVVAMPALVLKLPAVLADLDLVLSSYEARAMRTGYIGRLVGPREVGLLVLIPCAVGLALVAARRGPAARFLAAVGGYWAITLAVLLRSEFQPFRNLVPFVASLLPFFGIPFAASHPSKPRLATLGVLLGVLCLLPSLERSLGVRAEREARTDSRVLAREWLDANVRAPATLVVTADLAFLPSELEGLGPSRRELPIGRLKRRGILPGDVVVTSRRGAAALPAEAALVQEFGSEDTPSQRGTWRRNSQWIGIYRREGVPAAR